MRRTPSKKNIASEWAKLVNKATENITIVDNMRDYSKDPVFVKKAQNARKFIEKYGLPEGFDKKSK
ncbi:MAG: hypothetical protein WCF67_24600 [Chitinophagaceae bacterium]